MHEHRHKQQLAAKLAEQSLSALQFKSASARARVDRMVVWQMPVTQALKEYDFSRLSSSSSIISSSSSSSSSDEEEQGEQEGGGEERRRTFAVYSGEITQVRKDSVADGNSVGGQSWRGLFWDLAEEGSVQRPSKAERIKFRARKIPQVCVCVCALSLIHI